jgi:hypothetical protein
MPRRAAGTALALLLWSAGAARAQEWRAAVDSRVELMSILFRLAGNSEYQQCRIPAYDKAIERYFGRQRNHEAIQLARSLGIGFDAPMKLAVHVRDADSLAERVPLDRPNVHLYQTWNAGKARDFLTSARKFAADAKFQEFARSQQTLYAATNERLQGFLRDQADLGWPARFFGGQPPATFVIVPGLANAASYAVRVTDESGAQEIYSIAGVTKVDSAGIPVFDADWRTTMVHEVAHVYVSPVLAKFAAQMEKPAGKLYAEVAPAMRRQSYANWRMLLYESISRAATIEYVMEHDGAAAAQLAIRRENAHSFFWMSGLVNLLETYRKDRQQYPTFEAFMPRVVEYFAALPPRMERLTDRLQPKVVSTSIADGAQGVDAGVKQIVVRFSMAMNRTGPNKSTRIAGGRFDSTGMTLTIPVTLEPERDYAIPLRWAGGQAFVSADGVPLPATILRFRTGAAAAAKKQ